MGIYSAIRQDTAADFLGRSVAIIGLATPNFLAGRGRRRARPGGWWGEDFVTAAKLAGCTERVIMFRHLVPSFLSHIIASGTLAIPWMILGETALSFLGIGLQPPAISWGVLLKAAQNVKAIVATLWLLLPGLFVVAMILSFNFLGDGLRDAADPYK